MSFYDKVKWSLGILMVFVLIVATNLIDRNIFLRVKDSVITIYEDRLVANDLIFEISKLVQEKEVAVTKSDSGFFSEKNEKFNKEILHLISRFEQTKLTIKEGNKFKELKENLEILRHSETTFIQSNFTQKTLCLITFQI